MLPAVAVPFDVAYSTVTCSFVARFKLTLTVALPPATFSATETSPTESDGSSLSVIVPSAVASLMLAFEALLRVTVNVSSDSSRTSSVTLTSMVFEVSPAAIVRVPLAAV